MVRTGAHREPVAAAPDAFHGPAAIITAPVEIAGTFVSLPFRLVEAVSPRTPTIRAWWSARRFISPGRSRTFPFFAVNWAFGAPGYY